MSRAELNREQQIQKILASGAFNSGNQFSSAEIGSDLGISTGQARDLLNWMATRGQVEKKAQAEQRGRSSVGTILYQKPLAKLLRVKWRLRTNEEIGVVV